MTTPIHIETIVSPDGKIEILVTQLTPGKRVRVSIDPEEHVMAQPQHVINIVEQLPGHRRFKTADEVDAYIAELPPISAETVFGASVVQGPWPLAA